ncbi:hypothetical protein [Streptomyces griseus]
MRGRGLPDPDVKLAKEARRHVPAGLLHALLLLINRTEDSCAPTAHP